MQSKLKKILAFLLCFLLCFEQSGFAQVAGQLDISGHLANLRNAFAPDVFRPLHLRYLSYDGINNNFKLLLDKGSLKNPKTQEVEDTTKELLNYFFIGLTLPNDSFWVNLRPDAEDNIIDGQLAQTDVGKILLESDLQLKQDTARFTSPETPEGKEYWDKLYTKAGEIFGSQNITIPTLTRPWIVPDEIIIRETQDSAYIYKATLKVMLEQDYLKDSAVYNFKDDRLKELNEYSSQLIRELIIPKLNKEVNSAKRYASLRQVYYSLIMAQWFKQKFYGRSGFYSWLIDRGSLNGLTSKENWSKTTYFKEYQKSFKNGEYNIQEPVYTPFGQTIRSYFSGGVDFGATQGQAGGTITAAIQKGLFPAATAGDVLADNSYTLPVDVNRGGDLNNLGVDRDAIKLRTPSSVDLQIPKPHFGHSGNDVDWRFIEAQKAIQRGDIQGAAGHVKEAIRLLREVGLDELDSSGFPVADMINQTKVAIWVLEQLQANNFADSEASELLRQLKAGKNGLGLKQALGYKSKAQQLVATMEILDTKVPTKSRILSSKEIRKRYELAMTPGRHILVGFMRDNDGKIQPVFSNSPWFKSIRETGWPSFFGPMWNPERVIRNIPVRIEQVTIKEVRQTTDWDKIPPEIQEIFNNGILITSDTQGQSPYSVLMAATPASGSARTEGRTGILLKDGLPIIVEINRKEFVLEIKGIGTPEGDYDYNYRFLRGGVQEEEIDREYTNLEAQCNLNNRYSDGNTVRAIAGIKFDRGRGIQGYLLRLSPGSIRATYSENIAFVRENPKEYSKRISYSMGKQMGEFYSQGLIPYSHLENLIVVDNGADFIFTDFSDIIPIHTFPSDIENRHLTFLEAIANSLNTFVEIPGYNYNDNFKVVLQGLADSLEENGKLTAENKEKLLGLEDFYQIRNFLWEHFFAIDYYFARKSHGWIPKYLQTSVDGNFLDNLVERARKKYLDNKQEILEKQRGQMIWVNDRAKIEKLKQENNLLEQTGFTGEGIIALTDSDAVKKALTETIKANDRLGNILNVLDDLGYYCILNIWDRNLRDLLLIIEHLKEEMKLLEMVSKLTGERLKAEIDENLQVATKRIDILQNMSPHKYYLEILKDHNFPRRMAMLPYLASPTVTSVSQIPKPHFGHSGNAVDKQFLDAQKAIQGRNFEEAKHSIQEAIRLLREVDFEELDDSNFPVVDMVNQTEIAIWVLEQLVGNTLLDSGVLELLSQLRRGKNGLELKIALGYRTDRKPTVATVRQNEKSTTTVTEGSLSDIDPPTSTQITNNKFGGIDFRSLPIVTQAIGNLKAGISGSSIITFNNINLSQEWREIQRMLEAGITPSTERIKEYIQASCAKDEIETEIDKIISCIADILRSEEERCCETESTLRDLLVVLESASSSQQLKEVFIRNAL